MMLLSYTKLTDAAAEPARATEGAAGYDLCACVDAPVTIEPHGRALIPTGIAIAVPCGYAGFIFGRSGMGVKHGVTLSNGVGVIDSDYRGQIHVGLANYSEMPYTVKHGDRIAQLCVMPVETVCFSRVEVLDDTARGSEGFGSTGR